MSKPNKISTRAKIRLNYYRMRLQVSKFFDRFSSGKHTDKSHHDENKLISETSFSEPDLLMTPVINSDVDPTSIISQHYKEPNGLKKPGNTFEPYTINVSLHQNRGNQSRLSHVRAISSDESFRERKQKTPRKKRRSSRTRNRVLTEPLDTAIVNGDHDNNNVDDSKIKNDPLPAESIQDVEEIPEKSSYEIDNGNAPQKESNASTIPTSTDQNALVPLEESRIIPRTVTFQTPRENSPYRSSTYSSLREMRFAQPLPPVMTEVSPRSILRQPYLRPPEFQPRSILRQPIVHPSVSREMQVKTIQKHYHKPIQPVILIVDKKKAQQSDNPLATAKPSPKSVSFGERILSLANRRRDPSVYDKQPVFLKFGFRLVYQTQPARRKHIEKARKKAEKAGNDSSNDEENNNPSSFLLTLLKFVPRWLMDEDDDQSANENNYDQRLAHVTPTIRSNPKVMFPQRLRPTFDLNSKVTSFYNHTKRLDSLKIPNSSLRGMDYNRNFLHNDLRPQSNQIYRPTTTTTTTDKNMTVTPTTLSSTTGYSPKSKFTYQFAPLFNKHVPRLNNNNDI